MSVIEQPLEIDLFGINPNNYISTLETPVDLVDGYQAISPYYGGFYNKDLMVYHPDGRLLVEGIDYVLTYFFVDFSQLTGIDTYQLIVLLNPQIDQQYTIKLRYVGRDIVYDYNALRNYKKYLQQNPHVPYNKDYSVTGNITGLDKANNFDLMIYQLAREIDYSNGLVETAVNDYIDSLVNETLRNVEYFGNHYTDFNNPHQLTIDTFNLGNVVDLPLMGSTLDLERDDCYLTPKQAIPVIMQYVKQLINNHFISTGNVHGYTVNDFDTYSLNEVQPRLSECSLKGYPVDDALKLVVDISSSVNYTELLTNCKVNLKTSNFNQGYINPERLSPVLSEALPEDQLLTNLPEWVSVETILDENKYTYGYPVIRLPLTVSSTEEAISYIKSNYDNKTNLTFIFTESTEIDYPATGKMTLTKNRVVVFNGDWK